MDCRTTIAISGATVSGTALDKVQPFGVVTLRLTATLTSGAQETLTQSLDQSAANPAPYSITFSGPVSTIIAVEYDGGGGGGSGTRCKCHCCVHLRGPAIPKKVAKKSKKKLAKKATKKRAKKTAKKR